MNNDREPLSFTQDNWSWVSEAADDLESHVTDEHLHELLPDDISSAYIVGTNPNNLFNQ